MSTFSEFIFDSVSTLAVTLALLALVGGLLTFIFRRTIKEIDELAEDVGDIKTEHVRLSSETSRNADYWELSQHVHAEAVKATNGQVEAVTVRLQFIEDLVSRLNARHQKTECNQDEMKEHYEQASRELEQVQRTLEEMKGDLDDIKRR